jgi:D-beta-D-heptose 7-phosphate kinase/D-beta-D-heptose 1-phosphate adenosyltransferase
VFVAGDVRPDGGAAAVAADVAALGGRATLAAGVGEEDDARTVQAQAQVLRNLEAWLRFGDGTLLLADDAAGALPCALTRALIDVARGAGIPILVEPKAGQWSHYTGATAIKATRAEAMTVARHSGAHELCEAVLAASGAANVVLSLAADGIVAEGAALGEPVRLASGAAQARDGGGTGDRLAAVLAMALAARLPFATAVEVAGAAAAGVPGGRSTTASAGPV